MQPAPEKFISLVELLRTKAEEQPNTAPYIYLVDGEAQTAPLTFAEFDRQARMIAAHLQQTAKKGDRALLLVTHGFEPLIAFLGCMYAGIVPVPSFPMQPNRPPTAFAALLKDADTNIVVTNSALRANAEPLLSQIPGLGPLHWVEKDQLAPALAEEWRMPDLHIDDPLLILYTSGSTSQPKGVYITNRGFDQQAQRAMILLEMMGEAKVVTWAPFYHGAGLMSVGVVPLLAPWHLIAMPAAAVMEKPLRWLKAVSDYQATSSGGPNFLYQYCVDRVTPAEREGLDFANWFSANCAGEPIRMPTLEAFATAYAPYNFRRESFSTAYALSESGLTGTLSFGIKARALDRAALLENKVKPSTEDDPGATVLVSCGIPAMGVTLKIVDPQTCLECPPDTVGEIWMQSPVAASGYWNKPRETQETFHAQLADTGEGPYLRTGDLGFLYEDELYVAGRLKETIIVHGRNYYAQDIEAAVAHCHPAIQPAAAAAFSVPVGAEERIVLFQELRANQADADTDPVTQAIRHAVAEALQLSLYAVVLVKANVLPRTGTGKIQRYLVRQQFLQAQDVLQTV